MAFNQTVWPKARKEHRCVWCGENIPKGEKHAMFVGSWEGQFQYWRMHAECYQDGDNEDFEEGFDKYSHKRPEKKFATWV